MSGVLDKEITSVYVHLLAIMDIALLVHAHVLHLAHRFQRLRLLVSMVYLLQARTPRIWDYAVFVATTAIARPVPVPLLHLDIPSVILTLLIVPIEGFVQLIPCSLYPTKANVNFCE